MELFEKLDKELYISKYGIPRVGDANEIWGRIRLDSDLLNWAIKIRKDKFGARDIVNGLAICDAILSDYSGIDEDIYLRLVDLVYSNEHVARIVQNGFSNGGYSYLLMTLWNPSLRLTEIQKEFAVNEAMNKLGTVRYQAFMDQYSRILDSNGITDDQIVYANGNISNPIGAKSGNMLMAKLYSSLSYTQAHGNGIYDIRYWILKNSNWSLDEKKKLAMDFWFNDLEYDKTLEDWEWGIANDVENFRGDSFPQFYKSDMYGYTYSQLLKFYDNKNVADRIWNEIQFCKMMHGIRPQKWEKEKTRTLKVDE